MDAIIDSLQLGDAEVARRLYLAVYSLMIFIILKYFWYFSKNKIAVDKQDISGLSFLSYAFLLYFAIGIVRNYIDDSRDTILVMSTLTNLCFLLSLPYLSHGIPFFDKIFHHKNWHSIAIAIGFSAVILATGKNGIPELTDQIFSSLTFGLMAYFFIRIFVKRSMILFSALIAFLFIVILFLQFGGEGIYGNGDGIQDKFNHVNAAILSPAVYLGLLCVAHTYSWYNELNFTELSKIFTDDESKDEENAFNVNLGEAPMKSRWEEKIANDDLEKVIEEIMAYKQSKNLSLSPIISVAQKNNRNNTNQLKGIIKYEDYQINRNKVSNALLTLIG